MGYEVSGQREVSPSGSRIVLSTCDAGVDVGIYWPCWTGAAAACRIHVGSLPLPTRAGVGARVPPPQKAHALSEGWPSDFQSVPSDGPARGVGRIKNIYGLV